MLILKKKNMFSGPKVYSNWNQTIYLVKLVFYHYTVLPYSTVLFSWLLQRQSHVHTACVWVPAQFRRRDALSRRHWLHVWCRRRPKRGHVWSPRLVFLGVIHRLLQTCDPIFTGCRPFVKTSHTEAAPLWINSSLSFNLEYTCLFSIPSN